MGVDWLRARVKPGVDRPELERLVELQAITFQAMQGWDQCTYAGDSFFNSLFHELFWKSFAPADEVVHEMLGCPWCDDESEDDSSLDSHWSTSAIRRNPLFPPLWRMQAGRTFLPEQLAPAVEKWKNWATEVRSGAQNEYLEELYFYETSLKSHRYWNNLHSGECSGPQKLDHSIR